MRRLPCAIALAAAMVLWHGSSVAASMEGFKEAAKLLEMNMNTSAQPCQDFVEYTCGNYKVRGTRC